MGPKGLKKFLFNDHVFNDVTVLLPENRSSVTSATVIRLAKRFSTAASPDIYDALDEEVLDYKLSAQSEFPEINRKGNDNKELLYSYWQCVSKLKKICVASHDFLTSLDFVGACWHYLFLTLKQKGYSA